MKEYSFGNVVIRFNDCSEETYERLKKAAVEFEKNLIAERWKGTVLNGTVLNGRGKAAK